MEIVGGALLLGAAVALQLGRHRIARRLSESTGTTRADRGAFALGAGIMAVELPTALPYFAAIAAIVASHEHVAVGTGLVLLYNVAFVSPLLALIAARRLAGERLTAKLDAAGNWLRERAAVLLAGPPRDGRAVLAMVGAVRAGLNVWSWVSPQQVGCFRFRLDLMLFGRTQVARDGSSCPSSGTIPPVARVNVRNRLRERPPVTPGSSAPY